jgi:hypothetical protein
MLMQLKKQVRRPPFPSPSCGLTQHIMNHCLLSDVGTAWGRNDGESLEPNGRRRPRRWGRLQLPEIQVPQAVRDRLSSVV